MKNLFTACVARAMMALAIFLPNLLQARPVHRANKSDAATQAFLRQMNTVSNVEFYYTNRGVLFNAGNGEDEGLFWPRGSGDSYMFGGGLWFAAKKILPSEADAGWSLTGSVPALNSTSITGLAADPILQQLWAATPSGIYYWPGGTQQNWQLDTVFAGAISCFARLGSGTLVVGLTANFVSGSKPRIFYHPEGGYWHAANLMNYGVMAFSNLGAANVQGTIWTPNAMDTQWIQRGSIGYGSKNFLSSTLNNSTILAATPALVALSRDTGVTWDTVPHDGTITGIAMAEDTIIMIATSGQGIEVSSNRGISWLQYNRGLINLNVRALSSNDGKNFVAVTDSGAFVTNWQSGTWVNQAPDLGWSSLITNADLDTMGALHVADSMYEVFTQWKLPSLTPGERKLCDMGYNPNTGAGWYMEGEANQVGLATGTDGSDPNAKYISYVSPRYDATDGQYIPGSSTVVPSPYYAWPVWDTSASKKVDHNYYFGDYISDVTMRDSSALATAGGKRNPKPAMVSEEDIVNLYSDEDSSNNPEFRSNTGYPFGIDIQEAIYSWGFGQYKDMIFVRYKVKNSSKDTLFDSWIAPAFDPDLDAAVGGGGSDGNSYVNDSLVNAMADAASISQLDEPYRSDPTKLNMAVQWRNYNQPPNGKQYGMIGISFLESPVIDAMGNLIPNDDSAALRGYGPNSLFQKNQLGLTTVRDWTILNDPTSGDMRYDFVSAGTYDTFNGNYTDQRLLMATGPFTLAPGKSAEATIVLTFAHVSDTSYQQNFGALLLLTELAHQVFGEVDSTQSGGSTTGYFVNNFQVVPQSGVNNSPVMSNLTLHDPYPNPFSNTVTVQYQNANAGEAIATVTDMLGREVQSILLGTVPAGSHTITLDGTALSAGAYRITVVVGNETASQMVIHH